MKTAAFITIIFCCTFASIFLFGNVQREHLEAADKDQCQSDCRAKLKGCGGGNPFNVGKCAQLRKACIEKCVDGGGGADAMVCWLKNVGSVPQHPSFIAADSTIASLYREVLNAAGVGGGNQAVPDLWRSEEVPNAAAMIYGGRRIIVYRSAFFAELGKQAIMVEGQRLGDQAAKRWATLFVLAHELGHHVRGHTATGLGSTHKFEYEADDYAAEILKRMGAPERGLWAGHGAMIYVAGVPPTCRPQPIQVS
jgi:hypothetical protein